MLAGQPADTNTKATSVAITFAATARGTPSARRLPTRDWIRSAVCSLQLLSHVRPFDGRTTGRSVHASAVRAAPAVEIGHIAAPPPERVAFLSAHPSAAAPKCSGSSVWQLTLSIRSYVPGEGAR